MNWNELPDKDKVQLILTHILPHEMGEDFRFEHNSIIIDTRRRGKHPPINWPIAAWDDMTECWWTRDIGSNWDSAFDPLHNWNDTWLVVEKMKSFHRPLPTHAAKEDLTPADYFLVNLWNLVGKRGVDAIFAYTPEMICKAALQAKGVDLTA